MRRRQRNHRQGFGVTITAEQSAALAKESAAGRTGGILAALAGRNVGRHAGVLALIAVLGFLTVYPVSMLLYGSLHSTPPGTAGEFNLDGYRAIFTAPEPRSCCSTRSAISLAKTDPVAAHRHPAGLDRRPHRHAGAAHAGDPDHAAVLHSADPHRHGVGHAGQPAGGRDQPGLEMAHRLRDAHRSTSIPGAASSGT